MVRFLRMQDKTNFLCCLGGSQVALAFEGSSLASWNIASFCKRTSFFYL